MRLVILLAAGALGMWGSAAHAACKTPSTVADYLAKNREWKIVEEASLTPGDRKLWAEDHAGQCPGLAGADIKGKGNVSYAVALLRVAGAETEQKLVLFDGGSPKTLVEAKAAPRPAVVWVTAPAEHEEAGTGRTVSTKTPAFIFETLEGPATLVYSEGGQVKSIALGD